MKNFALIASLLCSCSFMEVVAKPASTAAGAAVGAIIGGPTGAAVGAGGIHAAWGITDAEEREESAISDKEELTMALLESKLAGNNDALLEYTTNHVAEKTSEFGDVISDLWFWIKVIVGLYVAKQLLLGRWTKPVLAYIFRVKKKAEELN